MFIKRISMRVVYCFLVVFFVSGCFSGEKRVADLFTFLPGEQLTLEQEKERLKYGELLQPEVSGDSLTVPKVEHVPSKYVEYVKVFVDSLNVYLKKMTFEDKNMVLTAFRLNFIRYSIIYSYVEKKDSLYVLTISRERAIYLGILEEYNAVKYQVDNLNLALPAYPKELVDRISKAYEKPRSIFWNSSYFNGSVKDFYSVVKMMLDF